MLLTLTKMLIVKTPYAGFPNFWGRLQESINKKDHYIIPRQIASIVSAEISLNFETMTKMRKTRRKSHIGI